tara:strand:+ start:6230 stop:6838 length:609 start_codon:yes stop_codon:yes gene_type:complete
MKLLNTKPDVETTNVDFPFGNIRDDDPVGSVIGTPANRILFSDGLQLMERIFSLSGLASNGLDDNNANGYQLFEALEELSTEIKYRGSLNVSSTAIFNGAVMGTTSGRGVFMQASLKKVIEFTLTTSPGVNITSMGTANVGAEVFVSGSNSFDFIINAITGLQGRDPIRKTGVSVNDSSFSPTAGQMFSFVKMIDYWQMTEI